MKPIRRGLVVSIMAAGTFIPGMAQGQTPPPPPATPRAMPAPRAPEAPEAPVAPTPRPAPRAYRLGFDGLEPLEVLSPRVMDALDSLSITPVAPGAYRLGLEGLEPMPAFHYMDALPPMAAMAPMALSIPPLPPMEFAFAPQASTTVREQAERAREQADRVREQTDRAREMIERQREMMDRGADTYLTGKRAIDNGDYERAIKYFDRVIEAKANNVEGAYYFKGYCLNKLGKREEALATLAEIGKQFPQSKWLNDAKELSDEIRQPSPDGVANEELTILALNSLMNSDPERAIPLVDKLITNPKKPVQLKRKALFILAGAQGRNEKARELMGRYAKGAPNPDIQYAAVTYLGQDRNKANRQILVEVYGSTNDIAIKRNVIKSLGDSRDSEHLLTLARGETNIDLRRDAIRGLGNAGSTAELSQLYASESNPDLKEAILRSMASSGSTDRLLEAAKNEKDLKLRSAAIRYLGNTRKEKSADALAGLYANETDKNLKLELMRALANQNSGKQLVDIARSEKDHELKLEVVKRLSNMRNNKEAQDYMMELLNK